MAVLQSTSITGTLSATGAVTFSNYGAGFFKLNAQGAVVMDTNTYLTGITSGQVTAALGYTPYNSSNPAGYITSSSSISGTAQYFANNYIGQADANTIWRAGSYTFFNGVNVPGGDFGLISFPTWSSTDSNSRYNIQLGANIGGNLRYRSTNINGAASWATMLSDANYNSYSPTLTGGGASGTWGISITGNAATVGGYSVSTGVGANTVVVREGNGYVFLNYINSNVSESENPTINSFFTSNGDGYLRKSNIAHVRSQLGNYGGWITGYTETDTLNSVTSRGATTSNAVTVGLLIAQGPGGNYNENVRLPGATAVISFNTSGATGAGSYNIVSQTNFQIRNAGGSQVFIMDQSGNLTMSGSMRAPIFYDSNDTGYYLDPNGTSNLQTWTSDTAARLGRPRYWTNRWAIYGSANDYMTGTNGWGMEHGGWDTAWKGGFSGWDIWGTGTGHPQGGGYIHAQGIISGQHAAASDGSSGYGWMMVGAHNATENRYWLRGKWGGSTSGWVEMISSGNIGSQSVSYANTAGRAYPRRSDGADINFYWSGQSGQPTWLWGSNDGQNFYVWNPSNFSVSYANSAGSVAWGNVSSKPSLIMYYQGFTLDANTMDGNSSGFTYSVNAPYTGPIVRFSETGYSLQLNAAYGGSGNLIAFRTRNGDNGTWNPWREIITTGNVGNQSVSYANNAGNVSSISGALNGVHTWTNLNYFRSNRNTSSDSPPLQAFSDNGSGAIMSFHRGGYYAVNFGLDSDNVMRIGGWSAAGNRWQLDMSGNMTVAGDVTAYSDARVKENVHTVQNALDKTLRMRGVTYNRTDSDDKKTKVGVIAQEMLEVLPEVVNQDNAGMYNVSYGNIVGVLIEAIKEQQQQIEDLKSKLDAVTK